MMTGRVTMKAGREGAESERQQRTEVNLDLKMTATSLSFLMYYECILLDLTGLIFGFILTLAGGAGRGRTVPRAAPIR